MKLSTKGKYGLRAMIDLARYSEKEPVSIGSVAARQGISERYLEQLVALLKKAGLVKSIRGASGGYVLEKKPSEISVGDILRALEGSLEPVKCAAFVQRLVNFHTFLQIVSFFTIITLIIVLVYTFCRPDQIISYIK